MNINRNAKKDDLKSDPLVESLISAKTYFKANNKALTGLVAVVAFAAVVYVAYTSMQQSSLRNAQDAFGKAMTAYIGKDRQKAIELFTIVYDNHGNTAHGQYSAYMLGCMKLEDGDNDGAIKWLEKAVARGSKSGFVGAAATEALATAFEHKGDITKALELYRKALNNNRATYRKPALRWQVALLSAEQNDEKSAISICNELVADTAATEYHQKAQNLLARIEAVPSKQ